MHPFWIIIALIIGVLFLLLVGTGCAAVVSLVFSVSVLGAGAVMWVGVAICVVTFGIVLEIINDL